MANKPVRASRPGLEVQRQAIREATRELLATQGVETLSAVAIAEQAGISRATLYRAYPSVEAVMSALYDEYNAHVTQRLAKHLASAAGQGEDWLVGIVDAVVEDAAEAKHVLIAMFRDELNPRSPSRTHRERRIENQVKFICQWWEQSSGLPADPNVIRMFVLLLQVVGLHVAMHPELTRQDLASIKSTCSLLIDSTTRAYRAQHTEGSDPE